MIRMSGAFVILAHSGHGPLHYDLMLEEGTSLATWQLPCRPAELPPGQAVNAPRLPNHRTAYLTYEGPVSRGRGHVRRVDAGACESLSTEQHRVVVRLRGRAGQDVLELCCDDVGDWTVRRLTAPPE